MSSLVEYSFESLAPYVHPPETEAELPWAELVSLDLSLISEPEGKNKLAKQLEHAVHHVGFFTVRNFGNPPDKVQRQFTLAKNFFNLPREEKVPYTADYGNHDHNGWQDYKDKEGSTAIGIQSIELFYFSKFTKDFVGKYQYPDVLKPHLAEIEEFSRVAFKCALVKQHDYETRSEDHMRYMIYRAQSLEEYQEHSFHRGLGHTDLGTAQQGSITVNLADTLAHLTGGYLKSPVHRAVAPPADQYQYDRTGILYFARPHSDTILNPISDSPVLAAAGIKPSFSEPVTMRQWIQAKQAMSQNIAKYAKTLEETQGKGVEVLTGYSVPTYVKA